MEVKWQGLVVAAIALLGAQAVLSVSEDSTIFAPSSWGILSVCIWLSYVVIRGWAALGPWDKRQFLWGVFSAVSFLNYLQFDPEFQGWGDVYFFCGRKLQYCTCGFRWNLLGWVKATVLWNFVLSSALGLQRFAIQVGLNGLLPGEEVVTKESFISICWRLIPYWLNNWEQQWGAECSSMMFELPHFAVELLVILPCVQILCARMKILAMPLVNVAQPPAGQEPAEFVREHYAPNILKGFWEHQPGQRKLMTRLRANIQIMLFTACITALAAGNALYVPLHLERQIKFHPSTLPIKLAGSQSSLLEVVGNRTLTASDLFAANVSDPLHQQVILDRVTMYRGAAQTFGGPEGGLSLPRLDELRAGVAMAASTFASASPLLGVAKPVASRACARMERMVHNLRKHADEITKMEDLEHVALIPLVESALAVMRLSCEKFFVLLSVFVSYLLFREPPRLARVIIRLNSRLSTIFQKVILYSFPAVCWIYGAGFIFSTFVSVVFWGGPALQFYESLRTAISVVRICSLKPATEAEIERMGGNCAICWGEMMAAGASRKSTTHSAPQPHQEVRRRSAEQQQPARSSLSRSSSQSRNSISHDAADGGVAGSTTAGAAAGAAGHVGRPGSDASAPVAGNATQGAARNTAADQAAAAAAAAVAAGFPEGRVLPQQQPPAAVAAILNQLDEQQQQGGGAGVEGVGLPCGHAYHHACLTQWLHQCHAQGVSPTCPMCQATIQLEVHWRFPYPWKVQDQNVLAAEQHAPEVENPLLANMPLHLNNLGGMQMLGLLDHQRELQELLQDMPQILPPEGLAVPQAELPPPQQQQQQQMLLEQLQQAQQQRAQLEQQRAQLQQEHERLQQERDRLLRERERALETQRVFRRRQELRLEQDELQAQRRALQQRRAEVLRQLQEQQEVLHRAQQGQDALQQEAQVLLEQEQALLQQLQELLQQLEQLAAAEAEGAGAAAAAAQEGAAAAGSERQAPDRAPGTIAAAGVAEAQGLGQENMAGGARGVAGAGVLERTASAATSSRLQATAGSSSASLSAVDAQTTDSRTGSGATASASAAPGPSRLPRAPGVGGAGQGAGRPAGQHTADAPGPLGPQDVQALLVQNRQMPTGYAGKGPGEIAATAAAGAAALARQAAAASSPSALPPPAPAAAVGSTGSELGPVAALRTEAAALLQQLVVEQGAVQGPGSRGVPAQQSGRGGEPSTGDGAAASPQASGRRHRWAAGGGKGRGSEPGAAPSGVPPAAASSSASARAPAATSSKGNGIVPAAGAAGQAGAGPQVQQHEGVVPEEGIETERKGVVKRRRFLFFKRK